MTANEAAQLIADALNAAAQAGFDPYFDEGHINVARGHGAQFEHAEVGEDHEGVWRVAP